MEASEKIEELRNSLQTILLELNKIVQRLDEVLNRAPPAGVQK